MADSDRRPGGAFSGRKREMTVLVFIVLTVAVFALLGVIQRAVERL